MAKLIRIVTAALLATHLIVGCCAHHAHADDHAALLPAHDADTLDARCCGSQADHAHHGAQACEIAKCSFTRVANDNVIELLLQLCRVPTGAVVNEVCRSPRQSLGLCCSSARPLLMPVRLHLAKQVLLI